MSILTGFARMILWVSPALAMGLAGRQLMQFYQLSSYQHAGYLRALMRLPVKSWWPGLALCVISILFMYVASLSVFWHPVLSALVMFLCAGMIFLSAFVIGLIAYREKKVKTRLVMTARVKRMYAALTGIALLIAWLIHLISPVMGLTALIPGFLPLFVLLASLLMWPFEKTLQMRYRKGAEQILDNYKAGGLHVIGITGSYGKTTVKSILASILRQQAPTLASPASFNTPLGLSRCIREELGQQHLYFIAEMGARHRQDIRVLSRMIKPEAGILVSIGKQHLQTLGSEESVRDTKYELIKGLPKDGFAVFSDDGKYVTECYQKTTISKALVGKEGGDLWAEDIALSPSGSAFTICLPDQRRIACETRLAGAHNIRNILLAAAMALHFGVSHERVKQGILEAYPPASRLQSSVHPKGYTIINNGFNSNPDSSRVALQVLSSYPGRHIVVTPGFIEQGRQEKQANRELGRDIAGVARMVMLIGAKHTRPIKEGLLEGGLKAEDIMVFSSLAKANEFIADTFGEGDVVLYENDLPDHYG